MRKVLTITERRADYSRLRPILDEIREREDIEYSLVVTGMHLLETYGNTINEIIRDGHTVDFTFNSFQTEYEGGAMMSAAIGRCMLELPQIINTVNPDVILSGYDIGANFALTVCGAHMNIPVCHVQGGEVSGTIDESIRHAMSKFAHYHFASNNDAVERLVRLGELPNTIFNVGCPSIDALLSTHVDKNLYRRYGLKLPYALVLQHPVTSESVDSESQINATIQALKDVALDSLIILPNNDSGSLPMIQSIKSSGLKYIANLSISNYASLLSSCEVLVGNSSSGIHEASTFRKGVVNIGSRQNGRLQSANIINTDYNPFEISEAIKQIISGNLDTNVINPYGSGNAAKKIVDLLLTLDVSPSIIQKRITY